MSAQYGDRVRVAFGVLGPVTAWNGAGEPIPLKGPRHRAVLARLIAANGRVVPVGDLVSDLWVAPPAGATAAVRTFVAALRRAVEPGRRPRAPAQILVTDGPGYALRTPPDTVDAWRFEAAVRSAGALPPEEAADRLTEALGWWRGPAYADFAGEAWAHGARARLAELRLHAAERLAESRLAAGRPAEAIPDLDALVADHPWREGAWRLLALALYRTGRQADALAVLRRARTLLADRLGLDPGPELRRLEAEILRQEVAHPDAENPPQEPHRPQAEIPRPEASRPVAGRPEASPPEASRPEASRPEASPPEASPPEASPPEASRPEAVGQRVWADAAADYDRIVAGGARARLDSTVSLLRSLAVTGGGGLAAARRHRTAAIAAAEELGDPALTARVIGAYDVPAVWTRADDPAQAAAIVAAAERALPGAPPEQRCRLLATIAVESRGTGDPRALASAREAERIARTLDDPALLAFALNGVFMQTVHRTGLAAERDGIGAELVALSARHGLVTSEVLGHLIRVQARGALADFAAADRHAAAADDLAARHELPLVAVFTGWYGALRLAVDDPVAAEPAYRRAAAGLAGAGMPGLERGLLPLALLSLRLRRDPPAPVEADSLRPRRDLPAPVEADSLRPRRDPPAPVEAGADWGPYEPWTRPLVLLAEGRRAEAARTLRTTPDPPPDLLAEAMWCLVARAAVTLGDRDAAARCRRALAPAAGELAGAGSGLLTLGPVTSYLDELAQVPV